MAREGASVHRGGAARIRSDPRTGIRADRHGRNLKRFPIDGAPEFRRAVAFGDLVAVDAVADRDVADDAASDVAEDRLDIGPFAETDRGGALTVGDPGRAVDDHTQHGIQRPGIMRVQERRAAIQAVQPDR